MKYSFEECRNEQRNIKKYFFCHMASKIDAKENWRKKSYADRGHQVPEILIYN